MVCVAVTALQSVAQSLREHEHIMKGLGYLISTLSVLLLGIVAWPKPDQPNWKAAVLICGMTASIIGMFLRFLSHRKEKAAIAYATKEAETNGTS